MSGSTMAGFNAHQLAQTSSSVSLYQAGYKRLTLVESMWLQQNYRMFLAVVLLLGKLNMIAAGDMSCSRLTVALHIKFTSAVNLDFGPLNHHFVSSLTTTQPHLKTRELKKSERFKSFLCTRCWRELGFTAMTNILYTVKYCVFHERQTSKENQ